MMDDASFDELYALGVPIPLIAKQFGISEKLCMDRASRRGVSRPPPAQRRAVARDLRVERIRAHIAAAPSVPMFGWELAA